MGYSISLNFNLIILIASWSQNLDFKIQILAGNSLKICVGTCFEISTTLTKDYDGGLHEIAKQGCNFLLLLVLQPYKISPKRSQLLPFSIKIQQNFKSTTFSSELPLSCSAKNLDFWHSGIRAMIQKRSRCLTPRVLMIFCVLLRSHLYATQLLTEEHTVLALQVCTIVYSLYTLTAARGATRYMMVGYEKNYAPFYRISGPFESLF